MKTLIAILILAVWTPIYAQNSHALQGDDGAGHIFLITGTGLTAPLTTFSFPTTSGTLLTSSSIGNTAWLLVGNSGTSPGTNFVGTTDNVALYLQAKNGAVVNNSLILNTDGSIQRDAAGNARGVSAVDLQFGRSLATQVASGVFSIVSGGQSNTASNTFATVGGGASNTASGTDATVGGGNSNTASNTFATVGGGASNTASGNRSTVCGGQANTASGSFSSVPGGLEGLASNHGQIAHAAGRFAVQGDAQTSVYVLRKQTTDGLATSLALDEVTAKIPIPTNGAMTFKVTVVGKETGAVLGNGNVGGWEIIGTIANNGGAALIIGANTTRVNNAPATWGAAPTVGVNGANMDIQVTGKLATNIDWVARVETVEVVF